MSGFVKKWELFRHVKKCPMNDGANPGVPVQHQSSALLPGARFKEGSPKVNTLLAKMNKDGIHIVCKNDTLICLLGSFLMEPGEGVNEQYVSQKMRQLGRLLQSLRELKKKENVRLADFFDPTNFDELVQVDTGVDIIRCQGTDE